MRNTTPTELTFTAPTIAPVDAPSSHAMALSALQMTREAIARWSGNSAPAAARDLPRVSPQARWLAQAQQDLAAWIDAGGFAQIGGACAPDLLPPLPAPVMYNIAAASLAASNHGTSNHGTSDHGTSTHGTSPHGADACVD